MNGETKLVLVTDGIGVGMCVWMHSFGAAAFLFCLLLTLIANEIILGCKR